MKKITLLIGILLFIGVRAQSDNQIDAQVIIIGAGISGLAAAIELQNKGFTVTILQGRNRTGGRIYSNRELGIPCDMGASWIHGSGNGHPITKIADENSIKRVTTDQSSRRQWAANQVNKELTVIQIDKIEERYTSLMNQVETLKKNADDDRKTLENFFRQADATSMSDLELNLQFAWQIESEAGGPIQKLSGLYYNDDSQPPGDKEQVFPDGYDQIIKVLQKKIKGKILLEKKVIKVNYGEDNTNVIVHLSDGSQYLCQKALVTVPLGVLKEKGISFSPDLPTEILQAINQIGMGVAINKVFLQFKNHFWDADTSFYRIPRNERGQFPIFINGKQVFGANVLMAFAYGNYAENMEQKTDVDIIKDVMESLKLMFPSAQQPEKYVISRWKSDPFSRGAYSFFAAGTNGKTMDRFQEFQNNQLFFAGEHTNSQYQASVHGAYLSGVEAAERIDSTNRNESIILSIISVSFTIFSFIF